MNMIFAIAVGGAFGAVARYLVMIRAAHWLGLGFPYGTLMVNVAGSFLLGVLIEGSALAWDVGQELRAFLVVGILGGFTTFSTLSLDFVALYERGQVITAAGYALGSVVLGVSALVAGMIALRALL
ncbi:MAG: fluoride efflux transporter CrcB [Alphaproteobacteria bacterium]|nr:fluoride efflux transporter CrcB [Alphaproteobacteria bacterium]